MALRDKLAKSSDMIQKVMGKYKNPAILCSFGKDSMVMLAIMRGLKIELPILFFREPFFTEKYDFANEVIKKWDLKCYDYPPNAITMANANGKCEVIRHYNIGQKSLVISDGNLYEPEDGKKFLCGLTDLLMKPTGMINFQWDMLFCGHKSSDKDPLAGDLTLNVDIHQTQGAASLAYPLRDWTDDDIWDYIQAFDVPFHEGRYDKALRKDKEDKTLNPDYIPACTRCLDKNQPAFVTCPKSGLQVTNLSNTLRHTDMKLPYYTQNI